MSTIIPWYRSWPRRAAKWMRLGCIQLDGPVANSSGELVAVVHIRKWHPGYWLLLLEAFFAVIAERRSAAV